MFNKRKICPLFSITGQAATSRMTECLGKKCAFCNDFGYGLETCSISGQSIYMPQENHLKATAYIPYDVFDLWNERMAKENPDYSKMHLLDQHGPAAEWSAVFDANYHAMIQIIGGVGNQRLFARAALYRSGTDHAVAVEAPSHILQNGYIFTHDGKTFELEVNLCPF